MNPTRRLLNAMLYFPERTMLSTPADAGLDYRELNFGAADGVTLNGWWIPAATSIGHVLFAHGNGGNISSRVGAAAFLNSVGFDVFLFDYRGYGRSAGKPDEQGTYLDARAARVELLRQPGVAADRLFYLGESLGGGVMVELAGALPPAGLILTSTFTSVRDVAKTIYPFLAGPIVPDAYPNLRRIASLRTPVLIVHGDADELIPVEQSRALYEAAPDPKRLEIIPGVGHDDLVMRAGRHWATTLGEWVARR